jgi:hypothetical protein
MAEQMTLDLGDSEAENKRKKVEEAKAKVRAIAEEVRAEKDKARKPNKDFGHTRAGGGGAGGDFSGMKGLDRPFKRGGKVKKFENGGDVYDNYERRSRINEAIRKEGLAPYEIKELEMKKPKDKVDKTIKPIGSSIGKGPGDSFNYEKAEKALADYRARMGSDAGGKTIRSSGGGGGGAVIPKVGPKRPLDMKSGGKVSSASKRADGCAIRGKTRA